MRRIVEKKWWFLGAWYSSSVMICVGSLMPIQNIPVSSGILSDKMMHATAYLILGMSALLSDVVWSRQMRLILISFFMGCLIEFIQPLTGRFFEFYDILANSIGLLFAVFLYSCGILILKKIHPNKTVT